MHSWVQVELIAFVIKNINKTTVLITMSLTGMQT